MSVDRAETEENGRAERRAGEVREVGEHSGGRLCVCSDSGCQLVIGCPCVPFVERVCERGVFFGRFISKKSEK